MKDDRGANDQGDRRRVMRMQVYKHTMCAHIK